MGRTVLRDAEGVSEMTEIEKACGLLYDAKRIISQYSKKTSLSSECRNLSFQIENCLNALRSIQRKEWDLSKSNKWTENELIQAYRNGMKVQRKNLGTRGGSWGTLRNEPAFQNNELARYVYRIVRKTGNSEVGRYEEVRK